MNTIASKFEVKEVPLHNLYFSPTNPRQTYNDESIAELAADILQNGLMSPITIRYNPNTEGVEYEIVVGSRRTKAHQLNGSDTIPCFDRVLTNEKVLDMQFSENLKREDVHPLEEAEAFQFYMDSKRFTVHDIAAKLNCSPTFIYSRIRLNHLINEAKDLLRKGKINIKLASHIAKFSPSYQEDILKHMVTGFGEGAEVWRTDTSIIQYIKDYFMTQIKDAVFDFRTPEAHGGSCLECSKNTACNKILFPEYADDGRCTDRKCWETKIDEYRTNKIESIKDNYGDKAIFLTTEHFYQSDTLEKHGVQLENSLAYKVVSSDTEGAIPALCVDYNKYRTQDFPLLEPIFVAPRQSGDDNKPAPARLNWEAHNGRWKDIQKQVAAMTEEDLLSETRLIRIAEKIRGLGYFEYAHYYFKNIHKKNPYIPQLEIANWQDQYDNMPDTDKMEREKFMADKLKEYYNEMKKSAYSFDHKDELRIHVVENISPDELEALLRIELAKNARRIAHEYFKFIND